MFVAMPSNDKDQLTFGEGLKILIFFSQKEKWEMTVSRSKSDMK